MVTLQMQYVFIYQALLEHYLYGDTELEVTSLETHLQKIYNKIPGTSNNGLEEEFKVSRSWTVSKQKGPHSPEKNRPKENANSVCAMAVGSCVCPAW